MLGAFLEITKAVKLASMVAALEKVFVSVQDNLFLQEREALMKGMDYARGAE